MQAKFNLNSLNQIKTQNQYFDLFFKEKYNDPDEPTLIDSQVQDESSVLLPQERYRLTPIQHSEMISKQFLLKRKPNYLAMQQILSTYLDCFVLFAIKVYLIYRNPVSPYITENNRGLVTLEIAKSNTFNQVQKFLKIYTGITSSTDDNDYLNNLIDTTLNDGIIEFKQTKKKYDEDINLIFKCKMITIEGSILGLFAVYGNKQVTFCPLLNNCGPNNNESQSCGQKEFGITEVKFILQYRYCFRQTGLELWRYNKQKGELFVFDDEIIRNTVFKYLQLNCSKLQTISIENVCEDWLHQRISNFEYLMFINSIANRSFNDLSQYPIFPWLIQDYQSQDLDLNNVNTFRDLKKPVGAINKNKLQKYKDLYEDMLKEEAMEQMNAQKKQFNSNNNNYNANNINKAYLYSTFYSNPSFVIYFLIRKIPEFVIRLQNGVFGPTDRIFRSVEAAWYATASIGSDFKELTPEFYLLNNDFLMNNDHLELGMTSEGEIIDDVELPAWAHSPNDFTSKMRQALESDYVSANLHHWIDLIFGYKQNGDAAIQADNVFYPLNHEENINWDQIKSAYEKEAMETQIMEFGQIPIRLFKGPHPQRHKNKFDVNDKNAKDILKHQSNQQLVNMLISQQQESQALKEELSNLKFEQIKQLERQRHDFQKAQDAIILKADLKMKQTHIINNADQQQQMPIQTQHLHAQMQYDEQIESDFETLKQQLKGLQDEGDQQAKTANNKQQNKQSNTNKNNLNNNEDFLQQSDNLNLQAASQENYHELLREGFDNKDAEVSMEELINTLQQQSKGGGGQISQKESNNLQKKAQDRLSPVFDNNQFDQQFSISHNSDDQEHIQ